MGQRLQNFQTKAVQFDALAQQFVLKDTSGNVIARVDPNGPIISITGRGYTEAEATLLVTFLEAVLR